MAANFVNSLAILIVCTIDYGSTTCSAIYESGVSEEDRGIILNKHNYLRSQISQGRVPGQPKATNMKTMKYSLILDEKAQEVANTCEFKHVPINGTSWTWVGQNLFMIWYSNDVKGTNWDGAIQAWFDEYKNYQFGPFNGSAGHYTQIVWADTDNVGCGYTYFPSYNKFYVCNYGPGGNYIGETPYKT